MSEIKGGDFLTKHTKASHVFIPEEWTEEQRMMAQTCSDFIRTEIKPRWNDIDSMKYPELLPQLLKKAGDLGILASSVPEEYEGLGLDFNTSLLMAEEIGRSNSFAVALAAHTGIGTLPILYFGNEEQKSKYLPKLASGEWFASYCLTEPGSGSDANSAKTKAVLSDDGTYYELTGQKMWITNAGFAEIFIVFAKIEDDKNLSAFIVEKDFGDITLNPEEKKMGIKGSSTRQVFFSKTKVPVGNLLGKRNKGFKIAVNILNLGRIKLGSAVLGGAKEAIASSTNHAIERKQFGKSLVKFGAIQSKLGKMYTYAFAAESAIYRAGYDIDCFFEESVKNGMEAHKAHLKSLEEFAIECAIIKVHASEMLDYIVDENVQIHGGMGFSEEATAARAYRDSRINRIFEGTNEINRMLTVQMLLKRVMRGEIPFLEEAEMAGKELMKIPKRNTDQSFLSQEREQLTNLKKLALIVFGAAVKELQMEIQEEQEVLMSFADILIEIYVLESLLLRLEKLQGNANWDAEVLTALMQDNLFRSIPIIKTSAEESIRRFAKGDKARILNMASKRYTKLPDVDIIEQRRIIANLCIKNKGEWL